MGVYFVEWGYIKAIKLQAHQTSKCRQQEAHCKKAQEKAKRPEINLNLEY